MRPISGASFGPVGPGRTQSGAVSRLRNKSVPVVNGRGKGDLFVAIKVQTLTRLNKRQRELLQELTLLDGLDNKS